MARVVLAADISGTRDGKAWPPKGSEVDLPDDEARDMIRAGNAVELNDERVEYLKTGVVLTDSDLAGAPTGRDATEGQPDTNLARAKALALRHGGDADATRKATREAAERIDYTDEQTTRLGDGRAPGDPLVGDDQPAPADLPGAADPSPTVVDRDGEDTASGLVEAGDAAQAGEERAVKRSEPRKR
jgi:hypothetical protein